MLDNLFKEPLDTKQTFIALIGAGLLILALWFYFLLMPQLQSLLRTLGKGGRLKAEIAANRTDIGRIDIFKRKLAEYNEKIAYYESRFPKKDEIPSVIESLSDMARDNNVKIASITPLEVSETRTGQLGGFYREFPVLISARSGYHDLGAFINGVESAENFMKIADIEIKANASARQQHDCEILILTFSNAGFVEKKK